VPLWLRNYNILETFLGIGGSNIDDSMYPIIALDIEFRLNAIPFFFLWGQYLFDISGSEANFWEQGIGFRFSNPLLKIEDRTSKIPFNN